MLIKHVTRCFGTFGCTIAVYAMIGCGAAPDARVESDDQALSTPQTGAIPAGKGEQSLVASQAAKARVSADLALDSCPTPSQVNDPDKFCGPWQHTGCTGCYVDECGPFHNTIFERTETRTCQDSEFDSFPNWVEFRGIGEFCGC